MSADDVELSESARRLIAELPSRALGPDARARLWQRVEASAAALPAAAAGATAATSAVALVKLVTLGAIFAAGIGVGLGSGKLLWQSPPVVLPAIVLPAPTPPVEVAAPPAPIEAPIVEKPEPAKPVAPAGNERAERQLLETARTALVRRDHAAALEAIAKHRKRFAAGVLAEERDGLEVQALVIGGQLEEARRKGRQFLAKYPNSVFGPVVEASLDAAK